MPRMSEGEKGFFLVWDVARVIVQAHQCTFCVCFHAATRWVTETRLQSKHPRHPTLWLATRRAWEHRRKRPMPHAGT